MHTNYQFVTSQLQIHSFLSCSAIMDLDSLGFLLCKEQDVNFCHYRVIQAQTWRIGHLFLVLMHFYFYLSCSSHYCQYCVLLGTAQLYMQRKSPGSVTTAMKPFLYQHHMSELCALQSAHDLLMLLSLSCTCPPTLAYLSLEEVIFPCHSQP